MISIEQLLRDPLHDDEFAIFLDNTKPIPLSQLATFLGKIDRATRGMPELEGLILQLSGFELGSNFFRFRAVEDKAKSKKKRKSGSQSLSNSDAVIAAAGIGAVATVVAAAITSGSANPSANTLVKNYNVTNVWVQAPNEPATIIPESTIAQHRGRNRNRKMEAETYFELQELMAAASSEEMLPLAGRVTYRGGVAYFTTMQGNRLRIVSGRIPAPETGSYAIVASLSRHGQALDIELIDIITRLADF